MANLSLRSVYKIYPSRDKGPSLFKRIFSKGKVEEPKDFVAVKDFNLEIQDGEFVVFVGPSGCGKSTTLRMIAGLEDISAGELYMDDELLNNVDPMDRDMAMVFQSYALYPHLSAFDNIAFGLKMRKVKTYIKDEQGNPLLAIDEKGIKELQKKINGLKKINKSYEEHSKDILEHPLYGKDLDLEKQYNSLIAKIENGREQIKKLEDKLEYLKNNPTPAYVFKHMPKEEIKEKVMWAASILNITELLNRKPSEMSGGQCQRVALGRAIVRGPKVFLLDEPLSNLDAKLRTSMRSEIVKLHQKLKTTFIYVTHDQIEAMTMGTKIVVMENGIIQQVDKPMDLFSYPKNMFVAGFIGTPQMNFFKVDLVAVDDNKLQLTFVNGESIELDVKKMRKIDPLYLDKEVHECVLGVRAEHIKLSKKGINVTLSISEVLGTSTHLYVHLENEDKDYIVSTDDTKPYEQGAKMIISFNEENVHLFDATTCESILEGAKK